LASSVASSVASSPGFLLLKGGRYKISSRIFTSQDCLSKIHDDYRVRGRRILRLASFVSRGQIRHRVALHSSYAHRSGHLELLRLLLGAGSGWWSFTAQST
jgi:hypothetical protein